MHKIDIRPDLIPPALAVAQESNRKWDEFSTSADGHALRRAKAQEQNGLCGYCECSLCQNGQLPTGISHIDHFMRQSENGAVYDWNNMILSCVRERKNKKAGIYPTCGKNKDFTKTPTSDLLNPHVDECRNYITFIIGQNDEIIADVCPHISEVDKKKAETSIDIYNLNYVEFINLRRGRYYTIQEDLKLYAALKKEAIESGEPFDDIDSEFENFINSIENQEFCSAMIALAKEVYNTGAAGLNSSNAEYDY